MLVLDLFVLHRKAHAVSLREACAWSAVWIAAGLGFGGLVWAWAGGGAAQAYLAGYLIEKSLSVDNIFLIAAIFAAFAIPDRYQHRVLMYGIIGALVMRGAFIAAGIALLDAIHPVIYVFGAVLIVAAVNMLRHPGDHAVPENPRVLRLVRRVLPVTDRLVGQRFVVRAGPRLVATPLLVALVVVEFTDVIFAVDSIPAVLAVTTDPFVVYTSNVFALLGMRALYFLLAGAAARLRYLQPGLAVILLAVAAKLLLADVVAFPAWSAPAFIALVLAVVAVASIPGGGRRATVAKAAERSEPIAQRAGHRRRDAGNVTNPEKLCQLLISLRYVDDPPVWRRVVVPAGITLGQLHVVIQDAMGWEHSHLHMFTAGKVTYGVPDGDFMSDDQNENAVRLSGILSRKGQKLGYTYDLGDDWDHLVKLEQTLLPGSEEAIAVGPVPVCLAGEGACPPEDCGGAGGYGNLKEALADPEHDDHEDMLDWLGLDDPGDFDPAEFDLAKVNRILERAWRRVRRSLTNGGCSSPVPS